VTDLSILIVHFETPELLDELLAQLASSKAEVIVVDNASFAPGTADVLARWAATAKIIRNDHNVGFAVATNQAFRCSTGRYVMTLNPDARVDSESLERSVDYLDEHNHVGLLGPNTVFTKLPRSYRPVTLQRFAPNTWGQLTGPTECEWLIGTGLVCRRSALGRDALFEEALFLFGEEFELSRHLATRGFKLIAFPDLVVDHYVGASYERADPNVIEQLRSAALWRSRRRYYGYRWATAFEAVSFLDSALMHLIARARREESAALYGRRARIAGALLLRGERFVRTADSQARVALAR
jgi:GT2 family glycosyltransferase